MGFSMEITDPEAIKKEIAEQVKPVPEEVAKLKELADNNVAELIAVDMDSLEKRKSIVKSIEEFGLETIEHSAKKNSLLQVSVGNLAKMGDEGGAVAVGLMELQREMKDLQSFSKVSQR